MRKIIKILTVVAIIGIFCMLFCGCDMLDDMKANHGTISEDMQTVSFKGKTFMRLPDGIPYFFNDVYSNRCNITTEDVPVLLSEEYAYISYYDSLNGILAVSELNVYTAGVNTYASSVTYPEDGSYMFFCEEEKYEAYSQMTMENADRIGFYDFNEVYKIAVLSKSSSNEILSLIKDSDNWDKDIYEDVMKESYNVIYPMYQCNKELTLKGTVNGYELYIMQNRDVYLTTYYNSSAVKLSADTAEDITTEYYDY